MARVDTSERDAMIARMWAEGAHITAIMEATGLAKSTVYLAADRLGLPRRAPRGSNSKLGATHYSSREIQIVRSGWAAGLRLEAIARTIGRTPASVAAWAARNNLPTRVGSNGWTYRDRYSEVRQGVLEGLAAGERVHAIRSRLRVGPKLMTRIRAEWLEAQA